MADDTAVEGKAFTLSAGNNWTATVDGLAKYRDGGTAIVYSWREDNVPTGYKLTSGKDATGLITTLTNTHTPDTTEASVKKVWEDANNQDGKRPENITINLMKKVGDAAAVQVKDARGNNMAVILNEGNSWSGKITGLPKYEGGKEIKYSWSEQEVAGYTGEVKINDDGTTTITNTHTPETTEATVKKVWNDADGQDGKRPENLTVQLTANDAPLEGKVVTLNVANEWTDTISGLPKYANGDEIKYGWAEVDLPEGYSLTGTKVDGTVTTLTNSYQTKVTASVKKVWADGEDQDGLRPENVTVQLKAGNDPYGEAITLNEENKWAATVENLRKYDDDSNEIVYSWTEVNVPEGYTLTDSVNGTLTTLTNTHTPATTDVAVKKTWNDNDNAYGNRPPTLTATLLIDGEATDQTVTLSEGNLWTASITGLPKYHNHGTEIQYSWTEPAIPGYKSIDPTIINHTELVNSTELTEATVLKVWDEAASKHTELPTNVSVTLCANGVAMEGKTVTLSADNGWTYTETGLPKFVNGAEVKYTWVEDADALVAGHPGYSMDKTETNGTVTTITNTYDATGSFPLTATKTIEGRTFNENDRYTFTVTADSDTPMPKQTEVTIEPREGNEVAVNFGNISFGLADAGKTYTYTITETGEVKGVTNDSARTVTLVVEDDGDGELDVTPTYKSGNEVVENLTFINKYHAEAVEATLEAKKTVNVGEVKEGDFTFTLAGKDGAPMPTEGFDADTNTATASNGADGTVTFGAIRFEETGTYNYTITEAADDKHPGWTFSDKVVEAVVEVTDDNEGQLVAEITYDGFPAVTETVGPDGGTVTQAYAPTFENTYKAEGTATIQVTKELLGREWKEGDAFTFELTAEDGTPMPESTTAEAKADNDHVATFGAITYTQGDLAGAAVVDGKLTKTFTYTVTEKGEYDNPRGVSYDATPYSVLVTVTDEGAGELGTSVRYVTGGEAVNPATEDALTVTNTYEAKQVSVPLEATKVLEGKKLEADEFAFVLTGEDGAPMPAGTVDGKNTVTNGADGKVRFDGITFRSEDLRNESGIVVPQEFRYTIAEVNAGRPGYTYDGTTHEAVITVSDDGEGSLVAKVAYDGKPEPPAFKNSYFGAVGTVEFDKHLYGGDASRGFGFTLTAAGDDWAPRAGGSTVSYDATSEIYDEGQAFEVKVTNGAFADGVAKVTLPEIRYAKPGTYRYLLTEDKTANSDDAVYRVTVTVGEDQKAKTSYELVYGDEAPRAVDAASFYNNGRVALGFRSMALAAMNAEGEVAYARPEVRKVVENGALVDGAYSFELRDAGGKLLETATNDATGTVSFGDPIRFDEPGEYRYAITEVAGTSGKMLYDSSTIEWVVTVSRGEGGALEVSEAYVRDGAVVDDPTFTNVVRSLRVNAVKRSREAPYDPLEGSTYGIWMANPGGNDVYMGNDTSDAGGNLWYYIPTTEHVAYYLLEEAAPHGHLVDSYPTDYFTITSDENGYRIVYENDPEFYELVPELRGLI